MSTAGLRVAFDMDGTVADMHSVLRREADRLFGPGVSGASAGASPTPQEIAATGVPKVVAADIRDLTREQLRALWEHVERIEDFWTTLPEMEDGIVARIAAAARERRWDGRRTDPAPDAALAPRARVRAPVGLRARAVARAPGVGAAAERRGGRPAGELSGRDGRQQGPGAADLARITRDDAARPAACRRQADDLDRRRGHLAGSLRRSAQTIAGGPLGEKITR
jgi:hypothetical protein